MDITNDIVLEIPAQPGSDTLTALHDVAGFDDVYSGEPGIYYVACNVLNVASIETALADAGFTVKRLPRVSRTVELESDREGINMFSEITTDLECGWHQRRLVDVVYGDGNRMEFTGPESVISEATDMLRRVWGDSVVKQVVETDSPAVSEGKVALAVGRRSTPPTVMEVLNLCLDVDPTAFHVAKDHKNGIVVYASRALAEEVTNRLRASGMEVGEAVLPLHEFVGSVAHLNDRSRQVLLRELKVEGILKLSEMVEFDARIVEEETLSEPADTIHVTVRGPSGLIQEPIERIRNLLTSSGVKLTQQPKMAARGVTQ